MARNKAWVIIEGRWGSLSAEAGDYDVFAEEIKTVLEDPGREGETVAVEVVTSIDDVLPQAIAVAREAILVFLTRGMLFRAQEIVREHPNLRVVLLTGLPDRVGYDRGVFVADKGNIGGRDALLRTVLGEEVPSDWTVDPESGRSNSSPKFLELVDAVADMIRNNASEIVGGDIKTAARVIVAKLAHEYRLAPSEVAGTQFGGDGDGHESKT